MLNRDLTSQTKVAGTEDRFRNSAPERALVKEWLEQGRTPAEIDSKDRVERRAEHLGIKRAVASKFAIDVKEAVDIRAVRRAPHPKNPGIERIIRDDDLLSSVFLERGAEAPKSVCCISENGRQIGTGFLVCPRVMLTNAHVICNPETARFCSAEFNFEDNLFGTKIKDTVTFQFFPNELFISSPEE